MGVCRSMASAASSGGALPRCCKHCQSTAVEHMLVSVGPADMYRPNQTVFNYLCRLSILDPYTFIQCVQLEDSNLPEKVHKANSPAHQSQ